MMKAPLATTLVLLTLAFSGCAFDLTRVKQMPVTLTPDLGGEQSIRLAEPATVSIGTGFLVRLKANTVWQKIGRTEFGDAYTSKDQVLTVEASDIYEAALVVKEGSVTGFYLLLEKKFCPASNPVKINLIKKI